MGERLLGELHERLRELREEHGYSSRLKPARLYHVTTDYIIGITDVPENTFYDLLDKTHEDVKTNIYH